MMAATQEITINVHINEHCQSIENLNSTRDQSKLFQIDTKTIAFSSVANRIPEVFRDIKSFAVLFANTNYKWKLFCYNPTHAKTEIVTNKDLKSQIATFNASNDEHFKLRVVFFQQQLEEEKKEANNQPQKPAKAEQNEYDAKQKLPYFIQITEVTEDDFTVQLSVLETTKKHRKFQLKEISNTDTELTKITLKGKKALAEGVIDFVDFEDTEKDAYIIAAYHKNKEKLPVSNAIKLTKHPSKLDINSYKPNCIDPSTIIKILDENDKQIHLYWHIPLNTFGKIEYKIISNLGDEKVELLPYSISLSKVPVEIQIITISMFEDEDDNNAPKPYESDPVIVSVGPKKQVFDIMIDYIHDENKPISVQCDENINFKEFKKLIVDTIEVRNDTGIKIGHIVDDYSDAHPVNEQNFNEILSELRKQEPRKLVVGFNPETPKITDVSFLKGEMNVKLSSNRINIFCFEIQPEHKEAIDNTRQFSKKINNINPNCKYRVRVKAKNQFGESKWCTWSDLPLHQFSKNHICDQIQQWIHNDINYQKSIASFKDHSLSGDVLQHLSDEESKAKIKQAIQHFMTAETLDIISTSFIKWRSSKSDILGTKTQEEIAHFLCNIPVNAFIKIIQNSDVDGSNIIEFLYQNENDIFKLTGYDSNELEQIKLMLSKYATLTRKQLIYAVNNNLPSYSKGLLEIINSKFDFEMLHYNIKNNKNIESFSDEITNFVDEISQANKNDHDLVQRTYKSLAQCFISEERKNNLADWICCYCGNCNFSQQVNNEMNYDLKICTLCGMSQLSSIVVKIRGDDTFINHDNVFAKKDDEIEDDEIKKLIKSVVNSKNEKLDLKCLNRTDDKPCPIMMRMCKILIKYKKWLVRQSKTKNGDDITNTVSVDISVIDNAFYKKAFLNAAKSVDKTKITENDLKELEQMINDNQNNIAEIKTFAKMDKKTFIATINNNMSKRKTAGVTRLYRTLKKSLQNEAQDRFLCSSEVADIEKDFFHILHCHIDNGDKHTKINAFKFFEKAVHFEENEMQKKACKSVKRRQGRIHLRNFRIKQHKKHELDVEDEKHEKEPVYADDMSTNFWQIEQYHIQSELDKIHSYLVHPDWNQLEEKNESRDLLDAIGDDDEKKVKDNINFDLFQAANKYMSEFGQIKEYGFGEVYKHPELEPVFSSVQAEITQNTICKLGKMEFDNELIKAINKHKLAMDVNTIQEELRCKYYDKQYNIIRNEPISIRHILAIVIYTDISVFCTKFRETYRSVSQESKRDARLRLKKHLQLYYMARSLYEAIEFFGERMPRKMKVFHGLGMLLYFEKFTAQFNAPTSTTTSKTTAQQFSQCVGIILELKSAVKNNNDITKQIPKYISVSWLSEFVRESEMLFYGSYFTITNIIESENLQEHRQKIKLFNKFLQTTQGNQIDWKDDNSKKMSKMIVGQQNYAPSYHRPAYSTGSYGSYIYDKDTHLPYEIPDKNQYGRELFRFVCRHENRREICVENFKALPKSMMTALFMNDKQYLSVIPILKLFPYLKTLELSHLNIDDMVADCKNYVNIILEYETIINDRYELNINNLKNRYLKQITFQSEPQKNSYHNLKLQQIERANSDDFKTSQWTVRYRCKNDTNVHVLTFINKDDNKEQQIEELQKEQQAQEEQQIKLKQFKARQRQYTGAELRFRDEHKETRGVGLIYSKFSNAQDEDQRASQRMTLNLDIVDDIDAKDIDETVFKYGSQMQCLEQALKTNEDLRHYFAVSEKQNLPFLTYMVDSYTKDKAAYYDNTGKTMTVNEWVTQNKFMQALRKRNKKKAELLEAAMTNYGNRIMQRLDFNPPFFINDDLQHIAEYIVAIPMFIQKLLTQLATKAPFQLDLVIALEGATYLKKEKEDNEDDTKANIDVVDDDDDDDDDFDEDEKQSKNPLIDHVKQIEDKFRRIGKLNPDRFDFRHIEDEPYQHLEHRHIERRLGEKYAGWRDTLSNHYANKPNKSYWNANTYPQNKRMTIFLDRRRDPKYSDTSADQITYLEPPDNCNILPHDRVPEIGFDFIQKCILPRYDDNITATHGLCGQLITFMFVVEQIDEIKCYMVWNGQTMRFMGDHIIQVLPKLFVEDDKNVEFMQMGSEANQLKDMFNKFAKDRKFDSFYETITNYPS